MNAMQLHGARLQVLRVAEMARLAPVEEFLAGITPADPLWELGVALRSVRAAAGRLVTLAAARPLTDPASDEIPYEGDTMSFVGAPAEGVR